jgi:hypothetical protein
MLLLGSIEACVEVNKQISERFCRTKQLIDEAGSRHITNIEVPKKNP